VCHQWSFNTNLEVSHQSTSSCRRHGGERDWEMRIPRFGIFQSVPGCESGKCFDSFGWDVDG
jgi:hypothetical protein